MGVYANRRSMLTTLFFLVLAGLGLFVAIAAVAVDFLLPGMSPGLNPPQLLLGFFGLIVSATAFKMRLASFRQRLFQALQKHLAPLTLVTVATFIALELVLVATGYSTYFPIEIPEKPLETIPWFKCEKITGCRLLPELVATECENEQIRKSEQLSEHAIIDERYCQMHDQALLDPESWQLDEGHEDRTRIIMLGDSFTFGFTADMGKSFVETVQANFPDYIIWNLGFPTTGTNQAVVSFERHAPRLRPQITVLGFYVNDFQNNLFPMDNYTAARDENGKSLVIQQYHMDIWGHIIKMSTDTALHYRVRNVDPPASELERLFGLTRLGSVVLRATDRVGKAIRTEEFTRQGVDMTRRYLRELQDLTAAYNSEFLVLLIPHGKDLNSPGTDFRNAIMLFEQLGITYLNPIDVLDLKRDYKDYAKTHDIHWNTAGHQRIGAMLSDCLEAFQLRQDWSDCQHLTVP
ncbi:MAG: hypothetical protein OXG60_10220 [Chloroflexi bacterium]|nr:hypothetical protein [Chloroflexota bacterium]